jgi:hypothetical protein
MGTTPAALIRRRSLAMPGIATRHAKVEPNKPNPKSRSKSKPARSDHDQQWKPEMMLDSPLAFLSNMDPLGPPAHIVENRAPTPGDLDYSHLGSLKIGSLIVTNGPPSPTPSFVSRDFTTPRRQNTDPRTDDEYFTASEGGSTHEGIGRALPTLPPMEPRISTTTVESTLSFEQPQTPERTGRVGVLSSRRSGSPLKREVRAESLNFGDDHYIMPTRLPRPAKSALSLVAPSENHSLFESSSSDDETKIRNARRRADSQSAISLASEYMAELPPSPYARSILSRDVTATPSHESLRLERIETSESFEAASIIVDQEDIDEALGLPEPTLPAKEQISPETALRSHPPSHPALKSALRASTYANAKSDSGYNSSGSSNREGSEDVFFNAIQNPTEDNQMNHDTPAAQSDAAIPILDERSRTPDYWQTLRKLEASKIRPPIQLDDKPLQSERSEQYERDERDERDKLERSKSWRKSVRRSLPRMLSSGSTPTSSKSLTPENKSETKAAARQQRKLQKKRPLSQPPLSFGGMRSLTDGDVPRVPSDVYSRFSTRLAESPGMQHLERTYENASSSDSRHTSAKASPAATGGMLVPASYFPDSTVDSPLGRVKRLSKAIDSGAPPPPPTHRHSMNVSRRMSRGKAPPKDQEDEIIGVADFGDVAQSLGGSPYDIAASSSRRPGFVTPQVPHQFSTKQPRFGPREGWDAETASKFAQTRSRERAAFLAATETGSPAARPAIDARHSYHDQRPRTAERRPENTTLPRPRSAHADGMAEPQEMQSQFQNNYFTPSPSLNTARPSTSTSTSSNMSSFRPHRYVPEP